MAAKKISAVAYYYTNATVTTSAYWLTVTWLYYYNTTFTTTTTYVAYATHDVQLSIQMHYSVGERVVKSTTTNKMYYYIRI